jgi:hypothetical protein
MARSKKSSGRAKTDKRGQKEFETRFIWAMVNAGTLFQYKMGEIEYRNNVLDHKTG